MTLWSIEDGIKFRTALSRGTFWLSPILFQGIRPDGVRRHFLRYVRLIERALKELPFSGLPLCLLDQVLAPLIKSIFP